jgi:iron complex transport system substrate-binding protein
VRKVVEVPGFVLPGIEDITRRDFLVGAGGILLLGTAGCGGNTESSSENGTIRVEHFGGVTEVPRNVERIVVLDGYPDMHSLFALGVPPYIAPTEGQKDIPLVGERLDEVEVPIGYVVEPNFEMLAAEDPDLIIVAEWGEEYYERLSEVAPTILLHRYEQNTDDHLRTVARAIGRPEEAERVIREYEERVSEVAEMVKSSALSDMPFAVVDEYGFEGTFRVLGNSSYCGRTLEAVGASGHINPDVGEPEGPDGEFGVDVSTELLGDVLEEAEFIVVGTQEIYEGAEQFRESELWKRLPAVRNGAIFETPVSVWYQETALTRLARLDDIEELVRRFG